MSDLVLEDYIKKIFTNNLFCPKFERLHSQMDQNIIILCNLQREQFYNQITRPIFTRIILT